MSLKQKFISDVKAFMKSSGVSASSLGIKALKNPHAIFKYLDGSRVPSLDSADRVYAFISKYKKGAHK